MSAPHQHGYKMRMIKALCLFSFLGFLCSGSFTAWAGTPATCQPGIRGSTVIGLEIRAVERSGDSFYYTASQIRCSSSYVSEGKVILDYGVGSNAEFNVGWNTPAQALSFVLSGATNYRVFANKCSPGKGLQGALWFILIHQNYQGRLNGQYHSYPNYPADRTIRYDDFGAPIYTPLVPEIQALHGDCSGSGSGNGEEPPDEGTGQGGGGLPRSSGACGGRGCPVYRVDRATASVGLSDTPLWYTPPVGPDASLHLQYNAQAVPRVSPYGFGPGWGHDWLAYVRDDPMGVGQRVRVYPRGYGYIAQSGYANGRFGLEPWDASTLTMQGSWPDVSYTRTFSDGRTEVYAQSDGASSFPRRIYLSAIVDRSGNRLTLHYDSRQRLASVTDALGQKTTLVYGNSDPTRVSEVRDPFGRSARFGYDGQGRLQSLTDMMGLRSTLGYDSQGQVNETNTPYGKTRFTRTQSVEQTRLDIVDALGKAERYDFGRATLSAQESAVPALGGRAFYNAELDTRNSYYWNKKTTEQQGGGTISLADIQHFAWLPGGTQVSDFVESAKAPLENRVWYLAPGQSAANYTGSLYRPSVIARVMGGQTQATQQQYNAQGNLTQQIDPQGREVNYEYAANGIDLLRVWVNNAGVQDTLARYTYNSQHLPLSHTDAAGQTTRYTYNAAGQKLTERDALGQTTHWDYDSGGYLTRVINANGKTQASYTYDSVGRVSGETDSEGRTVRYAYDDLNRLTQTTYPDGTEEQRTYDKLDLASVTDRLGRTTRYSFDAMRRLTVETRPDGSTIRSGYDADGGLVSLTDGQGNVTRWERDIQGRPTAKVYADGQRESYTYDEAGRVTRVAGPLRTRTQTYNLDETPKQTLYREGAHRVQVEYTYDSVYPRLRSYSTGQSSTTFTYGQAGQLGALQLRSESIPLLTGENIAYEYDALGRMSNRTLLGDTSRYTYDALGRLTQDSNSLGQFDYQYLGESSQPTRQEDKSSKGLGLWQFAYETNAADRRLKGIAWKGTGSLGIDYQSNALGQITQRSEEKVFDYGYDRLDRLSGITETQSGKQTQQTFRYDAADNLLKWSGIKHFDAQANSLNQVTTFNGNSLHYDAEGGLLQDDTRSYSWNAQGLPTQLGALKLEYDGLGKPIREDGQVLIWCRDPGGEERICAKSSGIAKPDTPPVSIHQWGENDRKGKIGQVFYSKGNPNNDEGYFRLIGLGGDGRYWYYPSKGSHRNTWWQYLGSEAPQQEISIWGENDRRGKVGQIFQSLGSENHDFGYFRLIALGGDGRYWYYPNKGSKRNAWWEYLGTEIPSDTEFYYTQGERRGNTAYAYVRDHLGSVVGLVNPGGTLSGRAEYDAYGAARSGSTSARMGYAGMYKLGDQYLTRFRVYDTQTARWISRDPIAEAGGINTYIYADGSPTTKTDPLGLATFICTKPLHGLGNTWGPRMYPESRWNPSPLYHQFLCVKDASGNIACGGQDRLGGIVWSGGKPSDDKWPDSGNGVCKQKDERDCVDKCVIQNISNPKRPRYGIGPQGTDCQEWADDVLKQCQEVCRDKK